MENKKEYLRSNGINVHQRLGTDTHVTAEKMDEERTNTRAYEYLCRLEEAKEWVGKFVSVPESLEDFREEMRKGVYLAEVAKIFAPAAVKAIFIDGTLQYRHTDNINYFLDAIVMVGLPSHFYFEVIDLYEKKNFPKVVYCIHALAHYLSIRGMAGNINRVSGKVFSKDDIERVDGEIQKMVLPRFENIKSVINENLKEMLSSKAMSTRNEDDEDAERVLAEQRRLAEEELLEHERSLLLEDSSGLRNEFYTAEEIIRLRLKTFLYMKSFDDIYYRKSVTLFSIKKLLFIFFSESLEMLKEGLIENLHTKISRKFESIHRREDELKDAETRIKLMLQNRIDVSKIAVRNPIKEEEDTAGFEKVLHMLQTFPTYFANVLQDIEDPDSLIASVIIPVFANVQGKKEEYLFINLVLEVFKRELLESGFEIDALGSRPMGAHAVLFNLELFKDIATPIHHLLGPNSLCHKLMINYFRICGESTVFRDGMLAIVRNLDNIEVEANPCVVYASLFNQETTLDKALENERVMETVQTRLMVIRGVITSILDFIGSNIENIPYIFRYFLKIYSPEFFFSEFIMPFILAPDAFNDGFTVTKSLRNKCHVICQLLVHVTSLVELEAGEEGAAGTPYSGGISEEYALPGGYEFENKGATDEALAKTSSHKDRSCPSSAGDAFELSFYSPLLPFFKRSSVKYKAILERLLCVSTLDFYFQFESVGEMARVQRSVVHLTLSTINKLLHLLKSRPGLLDEELNRALGTVSFFSDSSNRTLSFNLSGPEWVDPQDRERIALDDFIRNLKRKLIYTVAVCKGKNLIELLLDEPGDEARAEYLLIREGALSASTIEPASKLSDEDAISATAPPAQYPTLDVLKESVIDDLNFLEDKKVTSRENLYNEILSMLAQDIIVLRFMSKERDKEVRINELTYENLCYREDYLCKKTEDYRRYLNEFISKLAVKKTSLFNFDGASEEKESKYGSYMYTASKLMKMSVLSQVYDSPDFSDMTFIFLSNEPLAFSLEILVRGVQINNPITIKLDDVLRLRMSGNDVFDVGEICSFSTQGFIEFVNNKYISG
jgi:Ras GTPase-activating-like protein IQGAP2/3